MDRQTLETFQRLHAVFPQEVIRSLKEMERIQRSLAPIFGFLTSQYPPRAAEPAQPTERPAWSVENDPSISQAFKDLYPQLLESARRSKSFNLQVCAFWAYLELARIHYDSPSLGPVTKGLLWKKTCERYLAWCRKEYGEDYQGKPPTHRARLLKSLGLDSLPEYPPGRPAKW